MAQAQRSHARELPLVSAGITSDNPGRIGATQSFLCVVCQAEYSNLHNGHPGVAQASAASAWGYQDGVDNAIS